MTEWKTVSIFVLLFCAIGQSSASIVSTSASDEPAVALIAVDPITLVASSDSDEEANWNLPAHLRLIRPISTGLSAISVRGLIHSDSHDSLWISPPTELAAQGNVTNQPPQTGNHEANPDTAGLLSVASVAIPLPSALAATAAMLIPAGFLAWLWKNTRHPRD